MGLVVSVFVIVILPVVVVIAIGFLFGYFYIGKYEDRGEIVKTLSGLPMYIFTPFLVMYGLISNSVYIHREPIVFLHSFLFFFIYAFIMLGISFFVGFLVYKFLIRGEDKRFRSWILGLGLVSLIPNTGNIALPVSLFAWGDSVLLYAVLILISSTIYVQTFGVFFASLGSEGGKGGAWESMLEVFKLPVIWVLVLSLILIFGFRVGEEVLRMGVYTKVVKPLGETAIPYGLLILGIIIATTVLELQKEGLKNLATEDIYFVLLGIILKLVIAPIVGSGIGRYMGLGGFEYKGYVLQSAMPSAMYCGILSAYFNIEKKTIPITVLLSTLLSSFSLPIVIVLLGYPQ